MKGVFEGVSAALYILAAGAWMWSAKVEIPKPTTGYGGSMPDNHPFVIAMQRMTGWNKWAAGLTAAAAIFAGLGQVMP